MQSIYSYRNYREYLADFYADKKARNPLYSYKTFAETAGLNSANYLPLVIEGSRNLTVTNIHQFAMALKLRVDEIDFFEALVLCNQAKSSLEEDFYQQRVARLRKSKPVKIEKNSPIHALKDWFSTGILILAHGRTKEQTIQKCHDEMKLSLKTIESTLQKLIELGMLTLEEDKKTLKISSQQMTFHDPKNLNRLQESFLFSQIEQSMRAFKRDYANKKGKFLSHTLTVPKNSIDKLQSQFVSFTESLTQDMDSQISFGSEELAQINIQIFRPRPPAFSEI